MLLDKNKFEKNISTLNPNLKQDLGTLKELNEEKSTNSKLANDPAYQEFLQNAASNLAELSDEHNTSR